MKALVTGGTGYIGNHVVNLPLEHGHHVRLCSRKAELLVRLAGNDVSLFSGDLRDQASLSPAMNGMDVFYHIGEIRNTTSPDNSKAQRLLNWKPEYTMIQGK